MLGVLRIVAVMVAVAMAIVVAIDVDFELLFSHSDDMSRIVWLTGGGLGLVTCSWVKIQV